MGFIQLNLKYIRAVNSCRKNNLADFLKDINNLDGAFTKKRYLWNWIRGKNFYIQLTQWTVDLSKEALNTDNEALIEQNMLQISKNLKIVMETEKDEHVRENFVWNVTKAVPLLTLDILRYISRERLTNILRNRTKILCESELLPFTERISELTDEVSGLRELIETMNQL